jgi:archaellum component FlaG (FlaF/FlaG flagellin family)
MNIAMRRSFVCWRRRNRDRTGKSIAIALMVAAASIPAAALEQRQARAVVRTPKESVNAITPQLSTPRVRTVRITNTTVLRETALQPFSVATPPVLAAQPSYREHYQPEVQPRLILAPATVPHESRRSATLDTATPVIILQTNVWRRSEGATQSRTANHNARHTQFTAGRWWTYLFDDFDTAYPGYWLLYGTPTWGRTGYRAVSAPYSIWCMGYDYAAPGGYFNNMDSWIVDGPFDMRNTTALEVYFDVWTETEALYDSVFVGVSVDGINYHGNAYSGVSAGWLRNRKIVLDDYAGTAALYIGVQFVSDNINSGWEGGYIDNIELDAYIPSEARVDLVVRNPQVVDATAEIFDVDVHNFGPGSLGSNEYAVNVYVDGVFDSSARNNGTLFSGDTVTWRWQLAYIYPAGPHTVRVEVMPSDGDIVPANNAVSFIMNIGAQPPADLAVAGITNIEPMYETFDVDIANNGPAPVRAGGYRLVVEVDGMFDSEAWSTLDLPPHMAATWQWALQYQYAPGPHGVRVRVLSNVPDAVPENNSLAFTMTVPLPRVVVDLRLQQPKVTDALNDIITFRVRNYGPDACGPNDYLVRVLVDGVLDSETFNQQPLINRGWADWNWQLAYIYPPGLHTITIQAMPLGGDLTPRDSVASISHLKHGLAPAITGPSCFTGVVGKAMSQPIIANSGAPPYTWQLIAGTLPPGLHCSGDGAIIGTPTVPGTYEMTLEARDAANGKAYAAIRAVILPDDTGLAPLLLTKRAPPAFYNTSYTTHLVAAGDAPPFTWTSLSGLPPGFGIANTGTLAGVTSLPGQYNVRIIISDSVARNTTDTVALQVHAANEFLNGTITRLRLTVPWSSHRQGRDNVDSVRLNAIVNIPEQFVLDGFTRCILYLGDVPFNFNVPQRARWSKTAVFTPAPGAQVRTFATLRWNNKHQLTVAMTVRRADLTALLAAYGISEHGTAAAAVIPVRLVVNNADTGILQTRLRYRFIPPNGILTL